MSRLYIVSTPIGNLSDITYRAVEVLSEVDRILAEDTRRTSILLRHYGIETPLVSAHAHNEAARAAQVVSWLDSGEELALVSDAGTPLLSDPGARIVQGAVDAGHTVVPVPGASALLAALTASGLETGVFTFFGFPPRAGRARSTLLARIAGLDHVSVLYEAPGRLARLLRDLEASCGGARGVVVARELTKVHETFWRGTLEAARTYYAEERVRGEVVVLVAGRSETERDAESADAESAARRDARVRLREGLRPSVVARELAARHGLARNRAYEIVLSEREDAEGG